MLLDDLVQTSRAVAQASGRLAKIGCSPICSAASPDEIEIAIGMLSGEPRQGRIGSGTPRCGHQEIFERARRHASLSSKSTPRSPERKAIKGAGSAGMRNERASRAPQASHTRGTGFIVRLLTGELRQGHSKRSSSTQSPGQPTSAPAAQAGGDDGRHARAGRQGGTRRRRTGLQASAFSSFSRSSRCSAQPADDVDEALDQLGSDVALEWKLDRRAHSSAQERR